MDRSMIDRLVPLVYAALILASVLFFRAALAPIAVFGALALAAYYSAIRRTLIAAERAAADRAAAERAAADRAAAERAAADKRE